MHRIPCWLFLKQNTAEEWKNYSGFVSLPRREYAWTCFGMFFKHMIFFSISCGQPTWISHNAAICWMGQTKVSSGVVSVMIWYTWSFPGWSCSIIANLHLEVWYNGSNSRTRSSPHFDMSSGFCHFWCWNWEDKYSLNHLVQKLEWV